MHPDPAAPHYDTAIEEWSSAFLHGLGTLIAGAALVVMVALSVLYGDALHIVCLGLFGGSMVSVYLASTLLHLTRGRLARTLGAPLDQQTGATVSRTWNVQRLERVLLECDHTAIYLLIAGTYSPVMGLAVGGAWGWSLFIIIWALVAVGLALRLGLRLRHPLLAVSLYLITGWVGLVAAVPLVQSLSPTGLALTLGGGVAYTAGVVFFFWQRLPFNHAIWHMFVMAGSGCHFLTVWHEVVPVAPA